MSDIRTIFPGEFVKYADLNGDPYAATIVSAEHERIDAPWGQDDRIVCELEPDPDHPGMPTKLSAGKRLAKEIVAALGEADFSRWAGSVVELYPKTVSGFGKMHDVIGARKVGG